MRLLTGFLLALGLFVLPVHAQEDEAFQKAFVSFKAGDYTDALQRVDALLVEKTPTPRTLELKGRILSAMGKYPEAPAFFFAALEKDPKFASCHYYLGEASFRQKSWGEAYQYYYINLREGGPSAPTFLKLVYCALANGNIADASRWMTGLNPNDEFDPSYYFARAAIASVSNKPQEMADALRQARTLYGNETYLRLEGDYLFLIRNLPKSSSP